MYDIPIRVKNIVSKNTEKSPENVLHYQRRLFGAQTQNNSLNGHLTLRGDFLVCNPPSSSFLP